MRTTPITRDDLRGVFAVPPLARRHSAGRPLAHDENTRLARHIAAGGVSRLLYGGNAFLYHVTLAEFESLLDWMTALPDDTWAIPSIGPSFGRALDQAPLVAQGRFPTAMLLPCHDPRDAAGIERGVQEIVAATGTPLVLYIKEEDDLGRDRAAGLDVVARLVDARAVTAIKYAVVRDDPSEDSYLEALLARVDRHLVISGMGERPAVVHLRDRQLPGFTTGSGCVAPALSQSILSAAERRDWTAADAARALFLPLEDLRDAWGPARVLHRAVEDAGIATTGPIPPYVSDINEAAGADVRAAALALALVESRQLRGAHV